MSDLPLPEPVQPAVLDIQHDTDPEQDHGISRRIPHLGHALLFFFFLFFSIVVGVLIALKAVHIGVEAAMARPGVALFGQALGYAIALGLSWLIFPRLWDLPFARGIEWNFLAATRNWRRIIPAAVVLSSLAQWVMHFLPTPDHSPLEDLLTTPHNAWLLTAFGVLLAPLTEEIAFRGFLLPAFATAYDWLALDRTPAGLRRWETSTGHSTFALLFAAVFSSIPFALMHAGQLSHAWAALGVLYCVSLVLSYVRIRTHSVACSTLLHATYNGTIFLILLVQSGGYRHLDKLTR